MSIGVRITGANGEQAHVTPAGQLVVAPSNYSTSIFTKLDVADTAYNFIVPVSGKQIVITDIIATANKNVGVGDAALVIYEATAPDTLVVAETIFNTEMIKNSDKDLNGLNLITNSGVWINAKTDDDDIFLTLMYYYV